jgi:signal peptidase
MKKLFKIVYYLFFVFVASVVVLLLLSLFPLSKGPKFFVVQSGSMEPTIKTGSVVIVKSAEDYKPSDIITFGVSSKIKTPTTHRIVEKKENQGNISYVTKGDANNGPDMREVTKSDIIGKVLFNIPYLGYVVSTARKPYGFVALIIIPAAIIIFDEVRKIVKEIKNAKRKKNFKVEKGNSTTEEIQ